MLPCLVPMSGALAASLESAPLTEETAATNGMIRVRLSSIGSKTTYNLTVSGSYKLGNTTLGNGSQVRVEFSGGTVYVTMNGSRSPMGASVTLSRQSGGVKIAESLAPSNLYPGDMRFFYAGGTAYVVCNLYMEDYVSGVLPYEMDNSFPLEALKAQAVAARTYAIRAKTSSGHYDVTDTTTHQVFRGVNAAKTRCIQAVNETWGVVLKYNGDYVGAYYSASNGGQTASNNQVWGGTALGYLPVRDDPYDLKNPSSVTKSYLIYSSPANGSSVSAYSMIQSALAKKLGGSAGNYTIQEITDVQLHTPKYPDPSKHYTQMRVSVRYSGGNTTVDIPIFPTVESSLGLGINGNDNELYTVTQESRGFRVSARRYGHGVGMSQRGAQQMADDGLNYAQILGFYYAGATRVRMNFTSNWPSASPTPPPAEDPTPGGDSGAETTATVKLSDPSQRLNLRKEGSMTGTVIAKLSHGTEVTVLAKSGNWYRVRHGSLTGYVSAQYLVMNEITQPTTPSTPSAPSTGGEAKATVTLSSGRLNLRAEAHAMARIIGLIPNGAEVTVLEQGAAWSRVIYQGLSGYVSSQYLRFQQTAPVIPQTPAETPTIGTAVVTLENTSETLNFRQEPKLDAPILARLRHGTSLAVIERQSEWTKVVYAGVTGYVMNRYISYGAAPTPAPTAAPTAPPAVFAPVQATVSLSSGNLNLRKNPDTESDVLTRIPDGARVTVTQESSGWCAIHYNGFSGYVMRSYLIFDGGNAPQTPVATPAPTAAPTPPPEMSESTATAWINTNDRDRLNLRKSASSGSMVLVRVPFGEMVAVLSYGEEWTHVVYGEYNGYVSTKYLSATPPGGAAPLPAAPQPTAAPSNNDVGATAWIAGGGSNINLRKKASTSSDILMEMPDGAQVLLLDSADGWCHVIYQGLAGYVYAPYVSTNAPGGASTPSAPSAPEPAPDDLYSGDLSTKLNSGKTKLNSPSATLHLFKEPNELGEESGKIGQGVSVNVLQYYGANAEWVYVTSDSGSGYALRQHFTLTNKVAAVYLSDTSTSLTVRKSASSSAGEITRLPHGTLLTVLSTNSGWAEVRMSDGRTGYVSTNFISYK
jgi:SpoIID/LytB domain protein